MLTGQLPGFCRVVLICLLSLTTVIDCQAKRADVPTGPLPSSEVHFAPGISVCEIPFKVIDDNMYITIRVNDSVDIDAVFDTGFPSNGVIIIDSAVGHRLGLTYVGSAALGGAGDDAVVADVATGATIELPGVSFAGQQVLVVRNAKRYDKWLADAIIGGTMLNSCVVEIDHEKSLLRVYEKDSFKADAAGEPLELTFSYGIPVVEAIIAAEGEAPKRILLLADTGADVPFSLHSDGELELRPPQNAVRSYLCEGIKGDVYGQWFRMKAIRIGSFTMKNCLVAYPTEGFDDVEEQLGQNGFFGLGAQSRFTVTFDYPHARMYLKPNARFDEPFEFNMAGLVLRTLRGGSWEVFGVVPGSPGDSASVKKGDLIVAVDGRAASSISFAEMRRIFTREGRSISVSIRRDNSTIDIRLTLRRIV